MGIVGPIQLWKDYNRKESSLDISYVASRAAEGYTEQSLYFSGRRTSEGVVRIFAKLYVPSAVRAALVYFPDENEDLEGVPAALIDNGVAVLKADYMGEALFPRFTIYPRSLYFCKGHLCREVIRTAPIEETQSCWYEWAALGLSCITLLESLYPDLPIAVSGKGMGAATAFKLGAIEPSVKAVATMQSVLTPVTGPEDLMIRYRAALCNTSYAPLIKCPCFCALATNDRDGSLDAMNELIKNTPGIEAFRFIEKGARANIGKASGEMSAFLLKYLIGTDAEFIKPDISAKASGGNLYFEVITAKECAEVNLFAAYAVLNPAYRNWQQLPVEHIGGNEYIARTDVFEINNPVYAFANATSADGQVCSSHMLMLQPKTMGVVESHAQKSRILYDSDNGTDNWLSFVSDYGIHVADGPFGISGVTCDANELATFKIGDYKFKGYPDSMIQLIVNGKEQDFTLSVTDGQSRIYTCVKKLSDPASWEKLTLSASDFKSPQGVLDSFDKIVMLELKGTAEFIVNSIIWV